MIRPLLALAMSVQSAFALTLVDNGNPNAAIIVEADSEKSQKAAEAIRKYIEKISGAELPIIVEGEAETVPHENAIHVGHTAAAKGQEVPSGFDPAIRPDAFEEEGFVLRKLDDKTLLVAGNNDGPYRGTMFAAYRFLHELGCRFFFPGEWGEVVPEMNTITAPDLDIESRPDFAVRSVWLSGWVPTSREEREIYNDDWAYKIGFSENAIYPVAGDGFLAELVPPDEYFESNPEFFAMNRQGQRHVGRDNRHTMLDLGNDEMFAEAVKNLRATFEGERKMQLAREDGFGISPPDGVPFCFSEESVARNQKFRYPEYGYLDTPTASEEYFEFVARLAREFPDKWASTMAYSIREFPPQGVKFEPNMAVTHAPITSDVLHPNDSPLWRKVQQMEILRQYREQTPHVLIYDYNPGLLLGLFVPERDGANMTVNAKMYRDLGIKGMRREGRKAFMQTWLSYYLTAKLLWDADADVEAIKADFYEKFFGTEAGPHVRAWWDACEELLGAAEIQAHEDWLLTHLYTKDFVDSIQPHVEAALAAEVTEAQRERIEAFALIAENLAMFAELADAEREMDYPRAAKAATRMAEIKGELHAIYPFFMEPDKRETPRRFFAEGRAVTAENLVALRDGSEAELVADLPLVMRFRRDPFNEGVIMRWYLSDLDDSDWETRDTYLLLEQQEEPLTEDGRYYSGYVWYRTEIDVPEKFVDRDVTLHLLGLLNEGWVWVNGEYAGHRPEVVWWNSRNQLTLPVGELLKPGKNQITFRVLNQPDEVGGIFRRGFLHTATQPE